MRAARGEGGLFIFNDTIIRISRRGGKKTLKGFGARFRVCLKISTGLGFRV